MASLIFDFDGTLADSFPLIADALHRYAGSRKPSPEKIQELRGLPVLQAVRRLGVKPWAIPYSVIAVRREMYARMHEVPIFPGMAGAIKALHDAGHQLFILSSNREQNVRLFLAEHQLEPYFRGVYHCSIFRKGAGVKKIIDAKGLAARSTYYVGNEPADIDDVQAVGIPAVAVTWGGADVRALSKALPAKMVDEPRQLQDFLTEAAA